jgi:hypothetical protein
MADREESRREHRVIVPGSIDRVDWSAVVEERSL